jgi:hypothetical protein
MLVACTFGRFFRYRPLLPIGWKIVQIFTPTPEENNQYSANQFYSAIQASSQSTFIHEQLYSSTCDKNNPLTLFSQHKLARTAINKLFAL